MDVCSSRSRRGCWRGVIAIVIQLLLQSSTCRALVDDDSCPPSSCGEIHNISYPFRLQGDPNKKCGHPGYELACENNRTVLYWYSGRYYVKAINYSSYTLRVVDSGLVDNNCSALPLYSLSSSNISDRDDPYRIAHWYLNNTAFAFLSCAAPANSTLYVEVNDYPGHHLCTQNHITSSNSVLPKRYTYVAFRDLGGPTSYSDLRVSDVEDSCTVDAITWASQIEPWNNSFFLEIRKTLVVNGFDILWYRALCGDCEKEGGFCDLYSGDPVNSIQCYHSCDSYPFQLYIRHCVLYWISDYWTYHGRSIQRDIGFYFSTRYSIGILLVLALTIYKWRRRHLSVYNTIEDFLSHNNLMPIRYTYSDIKKMTKGFKDKLGEGGYGNVYKGKL